MGERMHKTLIIFCGLAVASLPAATNAPARSNILSGGVSTSYDYHTRESDDSTLTNSGNDDYSSLSLTPSLQFVSSSQLDSFKLSVAPSLKYDINESETDLDYNSIFTGYDRALSPVWQFSLSNSFLLSDDESSDEMVDEQDTSVAPELSSDLGRRRFWRNTLAVSTAYSYRQDSSNSASFNWVVLRNDDSGDDIEDYDRYTGTLSNSHRYNADWKTNAGVSVVYGDYEEAEAAEASSDLWEYSFNAGLENNMIKHNPLSLTYSYSATRYEESQQGDSDIHQMRFNWRRDFSPHFYTNVGAGPSYTKTEGQDADYGGNGIIEANYQVRRGSYSFALEKDYDVDNFSGTDERGVVDTWNASFSFTRQLSRYFSMNGSLGYNYEDRTTPNTDTEPVATGVTSEEVNQEQITAGLGVNYTFLEHYTASVSYTYTTQDSDRDGSNYDDHRVVLSLSWQQDFMRW